MTRITRPLNGARVSSLIALLLLVAGIGTVVSPLAASADASFANSNIQNTWSYTDQPVASGQVSRTWMWGPQPNTPAMVEPYWDASTGWRLIQYFDKSRMEITHPEGDQSSLWYVTNGLLAEELFTGRMQLGDNSFEQYSPANVNVAGDANDPNGPTYLNFWNVNLNDKSPLANGAAITETINRQNQVGNDPSTAQYGAVAVDVGAPTGHTVASPFWSFMTSTGPVDENGQTVTGALFPNAFYATGYPLTDAYWANVLVGGVSKQVLIQVFERRVLTYTPSNPSGWQVESGNVGLHYYTWRYTVLHQPALTETDLATDAATIHGCQPLTFTEHRQTVDTYYGKHVTLSYEGTVCTVFQSQAGAWWDTIQGRVQVYQGDQATGTSFDTHAFTDLTVFLDPADHNGWPPQSFINGTCGSQVFYKRWTIAQVLDVTQYYDNPNWVTSGVILTNPPQPYGVTTPCKSA